MKNKKIILENFEVLALLVSVALVVILSGCIGPGGTVKYSTTDGLMITEFSSDYDRYSRNEPISVNIEIENVGGTTARNTIVEIIGATWTNVQSCGPWELSPPDLSISPPVRGDVKACNRIIQPFSQLPEGVEFPLQLIARVTYDYSSNGAIHIPVLSKEFYTYNIRENRPIPRTYNVSNSMGPIHIDLDARLPIIVDSQSTEIPVNVIFKNVGSGVPIMRGGPAGDIIGKLNIKLNIIGGNFKECGYLQGGGTTVSGTIDLRKGETIRIPCTITITNLPQTYTMISMTFESSYGYYTEKPINIVVAGSK
ncbi:MAG: hypothetical protein QXZ20_00270 [Candidatus Aenigmatarchaeota archaeon]